MNHSVIVCVTLMVVAAVLAVEDQPELEMAEEIVGFDELSAARVARGVDQLSKGVFTRNTNFLLDDTFFCRTSHFFVVLLIFLSCDTNLSDDKKFGRTAQTLRFV
jgi:hypothetical protein